MIVTLALLGCAYLLPIPIAVAFRPPPAQASEPAADPTLARLIWGSLTMASVLAAYAGFLFWLLDGSAAFRPSSLLPWIFFVWVPWVLLARYLSQRPADAAARLGSQRSASLTPRDHIAPTRRAWNVAIALWVASAVIIGPAAWRTGHSATVGVLLGAALVWLLFGRRHTRTIISADPQPLAGLEIEPLRRCYRRRQALTSWAVFAVFATMAVAKIAMAAVWIWWQALLWWACLPIAVAVFGVIGIVHWRCRRQLDARIDVLLSGEGSATLV